VAARTLPYTRRQYNCGFPYFTRTYYPDLFPDDFRKDVLSYASMSFVRCCITTYLPLHCKDRTPV